MITPQIEERDDTTVFADPEVSTVNSDNFKFNMNLSEESMEFDNNDTSAGDIEEEQDSDIIEKQDSDIID